MSCMVIPSVGSLILKRDFVRREEIKASFFPKEDVWLGEKETGWVAVPRTFPLILNLIGSKALSGNKNPSLVYLELLSRLRGDGIIKMERESDQVKLGHEQFGLGKSACRPWQSLVSSESSESVTNGISMWRSSTHDGSAKATR